MNEREREALSKAGQLNAYLSVSSIPEAAAAARQREEAQRQFMLQRRKQAADTDELGATLQFRVEEGSRNRASDAQAAIDAERARANAAAILEQGRNERSEESNAARIEAARVGASAPTAKQRQNYEQIGNSLKALNQFDHTLGTLGEDKREELGGARSIIAALTPDAGRDYVEQGFSPDVQDLRSQGTYLDNVLREAVTSGVLSDQDVSNLKPLSLSGTPTYEQIKQRSEILRRLLSSQLPGGQTTTTTPPPAPAPQVADDAVVDFNDL